MRPSISSSTSTNAPNSVRLRTLPVIFDPTGYLSARSCHGLVSTCFRPSEMRRAVGGEAHHLAADARADRIAVHHVRPRIGDQLLVSERDAFGRRVVLEHDH